MEPPDSSQAVGILSVRHADCAPIQLQVAQPFGDVLGSQVAIRQVHFQARHIGGFGENLAGNRMFTDLPVRRIALMCDRRVGCHRRQETRRPVAAAYSIQPIYVGFVAPTFPNRRGSRLT